MVQSILKAASLAAILMVLSGCGNQPGTETANQVWSGVSDLWSKDDQPDPRARLTRDALDQAEIRLIYIEIPEFPSQATLQEVARNRANSTWLSVDGVTVTFQQGFLVATRGYGEDLMAADLDAVRSAVMRGSGQNILRVHDYLDGGDDIERRSFICNIRTLGRSSVTILQEVVPVRQVSETCQNPDIQFQNRYDFASDGRLVASKQWISPSVGYMVAEELSR
ncbi:YjbF family lipoprotein [Nereida sp. MMG025]|uniref:YjbF family lipoprotein n=1 Tax=Nereida sp. MMG025 TaxID=2909981 RepID=UPI001F1CB17F|nr:YjbF family lipoprotein [Nereida sp. MMG025]MCF6444751.1 YjbF family lipoprotein [Nereida sp. MMG025]